MGTTRTKAAVGGTRVGKRRSDRRWIDNEGTLWSSKFEWRIYDALRANGVDVEKCGEGDSFAYRSPVGGQRGRCLECGSNAVVQERTYTPDLLLRLGDGQEPRYIETKGYFPATKRALFRHFRQSNPSVDLCVILEADLWVTRGKSRLTDYFRRYLKDVPVMVYQGNDDDLRRFVLDPTRSP